jgi:hypothetical protein
VFGEDGSRKLDYLESWGNIRNDGVFSMQKIKDIPVAHVGPKREVEIVGDPKRQHMIPGIYHSEIVEDEDELLPAYTGDSDVDVDSELHEDSSGDESAEEELEDLIEDADEEEIDPMAVDPQEKAASLDEEYPMEEGFPQSQILLDDVDDFPQSQILLDDVDDFPQSQILLDDADDLESEAEVAVAREESVNLERARGIVREYIKEHKETWTGSHHVVEILRVQHYQIYHGHDLEQVGKDLIHLKNRLDGLVETIILSGSRIAQQCRGLDEVYSFVLFDRR